MLKVAAYCRVSTDKEDQMNSLKSQKQYFYRFINQNMDWELSEVYVDEGITGTSIRKRDSFKRMIEAAKKHQFDIIITKEISRFARNTLDSIFFTRELKELGIAVIFLNDNINTMDADAELRLTILSSIAQEESRKTSERVKWGQKRRMEQGIVFGRDMLGYDVRQGKLRINEQGAEIVRLIFHKFTEEGKGTSIISKELSGEGIPTFHQVNQWSNSVILRVLKNEKYTGDLVQRKTYTPNYLNHEKKYNHGEEELIIVKNHHDPIISRELFDRTQEELKRRSSLTDQKAKYSNRHCFSGKIKCGLCGSSYVSRIRKRKDGSSYREWRCYESVKHGKKRKDREGHDIGCNSCSINEEKLKLHLMEILRMIGYHQDKRDTIDNINRTENSISISKQNLIDKLLFIIKESMIEDTYPGDTNQLIKQIDRLREKKLKLIELFLSNEIDQEEFKSLKQRYEDKIRETESKLQNIMECDYVGRRFQEEKEQEQLLARINDIAVNLVNGELWEDTFYHNLIDKIVVFNNFYIEISLSSLSYRINLDLKEGVVIQ